MLSRDSQKSSQIVYIIKKSSSHHPPRSHPKPSLKSSTADSASLNEADIDNVELTEDDMVDLIYCGN